MASPEEEVVTPAAETAPEDNPAAENSTEPVAEAAVEAPAEEAPAEETPVAAEEISADELLLDDGVAPAPPVADAQLKAVLEAIVYITDEPLTLEQISVAIEQPVERVQALLDELAADCEREERGLSIREIAGGFRMTTKPEHHEAVRRFVKNLNPPMKLSLPALETLAVIAYKQPITAPEIMEIRGVQGAGVLKTLIDRRLVATGGRKQVVGKPILYKTTREFLLQFGLRNLNELPTLKEFQELARFDSEPAVEAPEQAQPEPQAEAATEAPVEPVAEAPAETTAEAPAADPATEGGE